MRVSTFNYKPAVVKEKGIKMKTKTQPRIKCNLCEVTSENTEEIQTHMKTAHRPTIQPTETDNLSTKRPMRSKKNTLLIGDSHIRTMNLNAIEKSVGGKVYTPGYLGGRRGRAYCSTRDWPEAVYPASNLTDRVPELLAGRERAHMVAGHGRVAGGAPQERVYSYLILQAPCNDISNLEMIQDQETQYAMAEQSSRNTLMVVERALLASPSLEQVVILLRPPRADGLYDLSEHSNFVLRGLVDKSILNHKITVASMEELHFTSEEKMIKVFGPNTTSKSYGIHMDGELGKQLFTDAIISGIRSAGLNRKGQRVSKMKEQISGPLILQEQNQEQDVTAEDTWKVNKKGKKSGPKQNRKSVIISNMFTGLN